MRSFTSIVAIAATLIASASAACNAANLKGPSGNPTTAPTAGQTLQMGTPFTITWTPSTTGPIDIVLLAGPTAQNLSQILTIASSITNNGSYTWNIPTSSSGLKSTLTSGYGLQLIDQSSCAYQFSPNFGIEDPKATTQTITLVSATSTANATGYMTGTATGTTLVTSPVIAPTKSMTVPASLQTTATTTASATAVSKGLAAPTGVVGFNAGLMMAAGVVGAMML